MTTDPPAGTAWLDQPAAPRPDERLDVAALSAYLAAHLTVAGPLTVRQFPAGHSNLTYLVSDGVTDWVLRRPPYGSTVQTAHDMGREYRILSRLHAVYPPAPRALVYCEDTSILGAPFYVMERLGGVILRADPPAGLPLDGALATRLCESFVDNLLAIHRVDLVAAGLADLGKPEGYVERQVTGWSQRYERAKTDDIPAMEEVATWLSAHLPGSHEGSLIHNDYKFDNLVLDPTDITRIIGVLDWEMATVGHPLMDLGTAVAYWVEAGDPQELHALRFIPSHRPGMMTRRQIIGRYTEQSGHDPDSMPFYYAFGLFKTGVVAQQIYARFKAGKTHDSRFDRMIAAVRAMASQAHRVITGANW